MGIDLELGNRFDCYKINDDTTRSWLYRVVAHQDDSWVYLHERGGCPVDARVSKTTCKVYQWLYGGWETSEFQNFDLTRTDDEAYLYFEGGLNC